MAIDIISIFITLITALSGISGLIAIIIVIWDHIKDDRRLTKRVQKFYEDIENYVYFSILVTYIIKYHNNNPSIISNPIKKFANYVKRKDTARSIIQQNFNEYSKYLGIASTRNKPNRVINDSNVSINLGESFGCIIIRDNLSDVDLATNLRIGVQSGIANVLDIKDDEISMIIDYFKGLRTYWKEHYSKSFLKLIKIRPRLKPKIDFNNLQSKLII